MNSQKFKHYAFKAVMTTLGVGTASLIAYTLFVAVSENI